MFCLAAALTAAEIGSIAVNAAAQGVGLAVNHQPLSDFNWGQAGYAGIEGINRSAELAGIGFGALEGIATPENSDIFDEIGPGRFLQFLTGTLPFTSGGTGFGNTLENNPEAVSGEANAIESISYNPNRPYLPSRDYVEGSEPFIPEPQIQPKFDELVADASRKAEYDIYAAKLSKSCVAWCISAGSEANSITSDFEAMQDATGVTKTSGPTLMEVIRNLQNNNIEAHAYEIERPFYLSQALRAGYSPIAQINQGTGTDHALLIMDIGMRIMPEGYVNSVEVGDPNDPNQPYWVTWKDFNQVYRGNVIMVGPIFSNNGVTLIQ